MKNRWKSVWVCLSTVLSVMFVCAFFAVLFIAAPGANPSIRVTNTGGDVAGFQLGLLHGLVMPINLIFSIFSNNVGIYETHNNGAWYNLAFVLGSLLIGGRFAGPLIYGSWRRKRSR